MPPASGTMQRLFFALWPDADVRRGIERRVTTCPLPPGAKATRPDGYHLTVVFLGDFEPLSAPMLSAIQSAAGSVRSRSFELVLDRFDSFERSRVGWLGPRTVPIALADLHMALDRAVRSAGVPLKPVTPFVPHVTVRRNVRARVPAQEVSPLPWAVNEFVLVQSTPGRPEPYRIVGSWPLVAT